MTILTVLLIILLIAALWGAVPRGLNYAAPNWLAFVVVLLVVLLLLQSLGVLHLT